LIIWLISFYFSLFADFTAPDAAMSMINIDSTNDDIISFQGVDIMTPAQKLLARQLSCDVIQGKSLLVTGMVIGSVIIKIVYSNIESGAFTSLDFSWISPTFCLFSIFGWIFKV
jgi:hypothetical protein